MCKCVWSCCSDYYRHRLSTNRESNCLFCEKYSIFLTYYAIVRFDNVFYSLVTPLIIKVITSISFFEKHYLLYGFYSEVFVYNYQIPGKPTLKWTPYNFGYILHQWGEPHTMARGPDTALHDIRSGPWFESRSLEVRFLK